MPKHECKFVVGRCECGLYKGLTRRQSIRYAKGMDCFSVEVFDSEFEKLHRLHLFATKRGGKIKKWFDLEVKSFGAGV